MIGLIPSLRQGLVKKKKSNIMRRREHDNGREVAAK